MKPAKSQNRKAETLVKTEGVFAASTADTFKRSGHSSSLVMNSARRRLISSSEPSAIDLASVEAIKSFISPSIKVESEDAMSEMEIQTENPILLPSVNEDQQSTNFFDPYSPIQTSIFQMPKILPFIPNQLESTANPLTTLQSGKIGSLKIYRSGKVRMFLGNHIFDVTCGNPVSFSQNLYILDGSASGQSLQHVANITSHFNVIPRINSFE